MSVRRAFSAAVFLINEGSVLLIKHSRLGLWLPPGGEREGDETPLDTARRELYEETGQKDVTFPVIHAVEGVPPGFLLYEEHQAGDKGWHMNFSFVAITSDRTIFSDGSFGEYRWVEFEEVEKLGNTTNNVRQLVALVRSCVQNEGWSP